MPKLSVLNLVLAAAAIASLGAHADTLPSAGTTVYWSETGPSPGPFRPGPSFIQAGVGLGGATPIVQSVVSGVGNIKGPNGLEAIDGRLWWPDQQLGQLTTSLPDGSNLFSISVGNPYDLDIEAGTLYWSALNSNTIYKITDPYGAFPDSSVLLGGLSNPSAVDAAGGFLYWSEVAGTDRLRRSNLDGSDPVTLLTSIQSYDFEVTSQYIYLTTTFGEVVRSNLDGSGRATLAANVGFLTGIDVDGDVIYVSSLFGQVFAMDLDGHNLTTLYTAAPNNQLRGVAVLSAVPEPGGAALLLAGLGFGAAVLRRRAQKPLGTT
jgi:hypothetical protein